VNGGKGCLKVGKECEGFKRDLKGWVESGGVVKYDVKS
jgi:hypothetical protein